MKIILIIFFLSLTVSAQEKANFAKLWEDYKKDSSALVTKYRDKPVTYSAVITSINRGDQGKYTISLDGNHGRIILSKEEIPADLFEYLWDYENKSKTKLPVQFTAVWYSNRLETFYFHKVEKITWTKPKPKKK